MHSRAVSNFFASFSTWERLELPPSIPPPLITWRQFSSGVGTPPPSKTKTCSDFGHFVLLKTFDFPQIFRLSCRQGEKYVFHVPPGYVPASPLSTTYGLFYAVRDIRIMRSHGDKTLSWGAWTWTGPEGWAQYWNLCWRSRGRRPKKVLLFSIVATLYTQTIQNCQLQLYSARFPDFL